MPESLNPAQQELARRVRDFAAQELEPRRGQPAAEARPAVIAAAKAAGLYAMTQPTEFGGTAAANLELTIAREELAAGNAPFQDAVFGPGPGVLADVGEPLRSSHLAPLLAGEKRGAFGFTEPDDAAAPTRARVDGDTLVIDGRKSYVTGGAEADFINTLVDVEDHGPALVVIDTDLPGVSIEQHFSSLDGSRHAAFRFADVRVPASHLIGAPGEGLPRAMRQIGDTRLAIAAHCVGTMRWVLDYLTRHLSQPDRGGKPRGDREGVRLRYAELRIQAFAARSMLYRAARLADGGENVVNEAIACKVFATEAVGEIVDSAIQLVGGTALRVDHPLAVLYQQVRSLRLAEGGNDVLRLNLARGKLDLNKGRL
ncbi:MAG: acyl-CoA dehydrogenase [Gammaproteobacteria bacterium]|nr:acyl-CoA dehydrogenase [Gammaproteobacteria bacterium]